MTARGSKYTIGERLIARPTRLPEDVLEILGRDIHEGRLSEGDRLPSEMELAKSFGVSRTVVREAISHLRAEGLVISKQGLGVFVTSPTNSARPFRLKRIDGSSERTLREVFELRIGVEAEAAGLAAARRSRTDVGRLKKHLEKLAASKNAADGGVGADVAFHRCIAEISKNAQISGFLVFLESYLVEAIRVARQNSARTEGLTDLVQGEHEAIFSSIAEGNVKGAQRALRFHLENAQKRLGFITTGPHR